VEGVIVIRLFGRNETNFNHNKNVLSPLSCFVIEEANGMFELEIEVPKMTIIGNGDIIKAPTPRGEQLFRVYRGIRTLRGKKYYARHIFYDLSKNFLINLSLNDVTCSTALISVLTGTEYTHNFTGSSDILDKNSISFTRVNPVQAILGENGLINTWGGNLVRDNFNIKVLTKGFDRGYEVRLGKNLIGIEDDSDESSVKTRLYPVVELGDSVLTLPEKYVDSPLINNYGSPIIAEEKINLTDEQKELSTEEIYKIMRDHCKELFDKYNVDKPVVNYKINFVELSKTEQYKDLAILEQLDLYDIVTCNIPELDINVKAKVIKYKYDCLKERYESIELGNFKSVANYQTDNIVKQIQERIKATQSAVDYATNVITGNKGGYVVIRRYPDGKPYEILIMDTEDINTAVNVLRINNSGLGFSKNGYNGPFETAMTIDGHIVADFIDIGTLTAALIKTGILKSADGSSWINIDDGSFNFKDALKWIDGTLQISSPNIDAINDKAENAINTAENAVNKADNAQNTAQNALNTAQNALQPGILYNQTKISTAEGIEVLDVNNLRCLQIGAIDTDDDGVKDNYGFKAQHSDGSYTLMTKDGLKRKIGSTNTNYHYLTYVGSGMYAFINTGIESITLSIALPSEFRGKNFKVNVSLKSYRLWDSLAKTIYVALAGTDQTNGTFDVYIEKRNVAITGGEVYTVIIEYQYIVIA